MFKKRLFFAFYLATTLIYPSISHATLPASNIHNQTIYLQYHLKWKGFNGKAIYTAERKGNHYSILSEAQGSGLASLLGTAIMKSEGIIDSSEHLKPVSFTLQKPFTGSIEKSSINWQEQTITLKDGNIINFTASNIHDPLSLLFQFYWSSSNKILEPLTIVTTKKVARYTFKLAGTESIRFNHQTVETQIWKRYDEEGVLQMTIWLSPKHHNLPLKMQDYDGPNDIKELLLQSIKETQ